MRPLHFVCLVALLFSPMALAQSSRPPLGNQRNGLPGTYLLDDPRWFPKLHQAPEGAPFTQPRTKTVKGASTSPVPYQGVSFTFAPVVYDSGAMGTHYAAVADVNGDGKPDLLYANADGLNVLLGNGDGTFQTALTDASGGFSSLSASDVNGDGKPDLLVLDGGGIVSVLLGNGNGTFQTPVNYDSGGNFAFSVVVADVNGDGKPDLLVANDEIAPIGRGGVGVLLGNGDGTFQTVVNYDAGGYDAHFVAVADVNGDGKADLLVADGVFDDGFARVGVLLGNGDGTFQTAVTYGSGGYGTFSVAVEDVNGDGKLDLLVSNQCTTVFDCTGAVGVLLGNGDGSFQTAVTYGTGGALGRTMAIGDLNGDGKIDVVVANWCTSYISYGCIGDSLMGVLLGNGDGTFQTAVSYDSGGSQILSLAVEDVSGDGKPDIVVAPWCDSGSGCANNEEAHSVGVLINTSISTTTSAVTSSLNPSSFGQAVTFTATVTSSQFFAFQPTGSVTITDGSTTLCNAVTLSGGAATCVYSALPVGAGMVTTTYSGDSNFSGSSATTNQTVSQAGTTTGVASSLNPSALGQPVTFTAIITPHYGGQASGTVNFKDGSTLLGSGAVSGNVASLTSSGLAIGTHSITAVYNGDSNFTGSISNTLSQVVTKATTTTTLLSSINPSVCGKSVAFTAVVSSSGVGMPTGKVQFLNGATVLATVTLTSGSAKYTTSKLSPGANNITAVYQGDGNNVSSTSAPLIQVVLVATTATLTSSPNPSTYGQAVIFTAAVTSSIGAPPDGEVITFTQGTTVLGTGTLSGGTATLSFSACTVGTKVVKAAYGGDANFASSRSTADYQVIAKATSTTALSSSQNPSSFGQPVTFTATVSPQFNGTTPTGSVAFYNGTATLGTVTLINGVATYTTTKLGAGARSITAVYKGSSSFSTSTSAGLNQVVNAASTTTTLLSSLNPSNFGQPVTFTSTVAAQFGGTVIGSITFMDGTTTLKTVNLSGGAAKYTTTTLISGTHNITATYNVSTSFSGSSASLTQTVN